MTATDPYRVLVVDDDPDVATYVATVLRRAGCEVQQINDPMAAQGAVREFRPDVVVTDIEMPGLSGLELVGLLRSDAAALPVIVMTAHASLDYAMRAIKSQADEFFTKPIPSAQLVESALALAEGWRRSRESESELERAAEVQRGLLPQHPPRLPGFELAGGCSPARVVGGDFYDWYSIDGGTVLTLADVMGKGIGAAIIAATVRAVLRSGSDAVPVNELVAGAASELEVDLQKAGSFVTLFYARLDSTAGLVRYADAGHGLTIVTRADGTAKRLATTSLPLGLGLGEGWREHRVELGVGDTLVSVSDGVLDLYDGTLAAMDEVAVLARRAPSAQAVVDELLGMSNGSADDVTAIALRRVG